MDKKSKNFKRLERENQARQRQVLVTIAIVAMVLVAFFAFSQLSGTGGKAISTTENPTIGNLESKAHMVIFENFKCPNCKNFEEGVMPLVEEQYINTNKIKLTFINFANFLGADAMTAALAGECVYSQNKDLFFPYMKKVFQAQENEALEWATPEKMATIASYISGVDSKAVQTCTEQKKHQKEVDADNALARAYGLTGTPSVLVNGKVVNATFDDIKKALDEALK